MPRQPRTGVFPSGDNAATETAARREGRLGKRRRVSRFSSRHGVDYVVRQSGRGGDGEQNHHAIREVVDKLGPVDLLVANAGVGAPTNLDPVNITDVEQMFRVNVFGMIYAVEAVLPGMLKRGNGHIAAVSSLAAYKGLPGESAYCASKAAVNAYMEGLRIHLRDKRIAVTTICPGFVKTPMTDVNEFKMPWVLEADEAA